MTDEEVLAVLERRLRRRAVANVAWWLAFVINLVSTGMTIYRQRIQTQLDTDLCAHCAMEAASKLVVQSTRRTLQEVCAETDPPDGGRD